MFLKVFYFQPLCHFLCATMQCLQTTSITPQLPKTSNFLSSIQKLVQFSLLRTAITKQHLVTVLLINLDCNLMNNILSQLEEAVKGKAEHMSLLAIAC